VKWHLDKSQGKNRVFVDGDAYTIQTHPVITISKICDSDGTSGKEKLRFLQLIYGWKSDEMHGMSCDVLHPNTLRAAPDPTDMYPIPEG
jgi:hypothetical protein